MIMILYHNSGKRNQKQYPADFLHRTSFIRRGWRTRFKVQDAREFGGFALAAFG